MLPPELIETARELDLLTYLQRYTPEELVHISGSEYTTRTHDSLKISNGKWHWFSRGIGGRTALDYLVFVNGMSFTQAVLHLTETKIPRGIDIPPPIKPIFAPIHSREFQPPIPYVNNDRIIAYLMKRGIDRSIIGNCVKTGILYEDAMTHAAVFLGKDAEGHPRHAMLRSICPKGGFKKDATGSDKRFCFSIPGKSHALVVCESPIDALSYGTIEKLKDRDWRQTHYLALCGVSSLALDQYLKDHPGIRDIILSLDQDQPGREASRKFTEVYSAKGYIVHDRPSPCCKDYNEYLTIQLRREVRSAQFSR